jgi:type VI secretion system secreted protein Hcp
MPSTRSAVVSAVVAIGLALGVTSPASAAIDMFLEAPGLTGESTDAQHKDAIDLLAYSYGTSKREKGPKGNFQDLSATKYMDTSSPALLEAVASGQTFASAKLILRKGGDNPYDFARYCFTGVRFTSTSSSGSGGEDRLTENITFTYNTVVLRYATQKPDGSTGTPIFGGWDLVSNVRFGNPQC